ncbi:hypothetical protein [Pseudomonas sp. P1.8]|uniref:hypothetical protein n=1 Tax=Pseudomonas sp. P1.8 TaxID=1699310 RepID=UPI0009EB300A|nr:hypothetical protein [Pseudomonas sp. P1.8]
MPSATYPKDPERHALGPDGQDLALPPPIVPAILKDEDGNESADGRLPRSVLNSDLQVTVPAWSFSTDPNFVADIVAVGWRPVGQDFVEVNRSRFPIPIDPGDKIVSVPRDKLEHGVYGLSYKLIIGGNPAESEIKKITVDRVAPDDGQQPSAVQMLDLVGNITDDYLKQHGQVRFKVSLYIDVQVRDRAIYYWTDESNPPESEAEIREQAFSQQDIDNDQLIITMYEVDIRARGHGARYIYYRLRDWAGNRGPRSTFLPVTVDLLPAPGNLKPPRVPLSVRGLIDRQHAREGAVNQGEVTVEIDAYDNPDATDRVLIDWDGTLLDPLDVDPAQFPLKAPVPWSKLRANGLGPMTARISYKVQRGGVDTPPSLEARVPMDLTVAGQDHANAPALLNTTLALLEIYGAKSLTLNTLLSEDFGEDADAYLTLYDDPKGGQTIDVYWGAISAPVVQYIVQDTDSAGKRVPVQIPWSAIDQDRDNLALPVYYTTSNGVNQQQAQITPVRVSIVVIEDLKEPSFSHADKFGVLNCCACPRLWKGVWVKVEGNPDFAEKDLVTLHWQGCAGMNGTSPIPGVVDAFPTTLTLDQARNGFEVHVADYEKLIAPMANNGSALCYYDLKKFNGGAGVSKKDFVIINRTMPSGEVCSPTNETCLEPCNK